MIWVSFLLWTDSVVMMDPIVLCIARVFAMSPKSVDRVSIGVEYSVAVVIVLPSYH